MRILHTADWHVGKVLKGRPRIDEHIAVMRGIVTAAREEDVDLVLVAGDVFDTAAPTPEAQKLVMKTLLDLRQDGRTVVVQAGNHDNPRQIDVFRPVLAELGMVVVGTPLAPSAGGTVQIRTRRGEHARIAVLPFVSQRYAVRAAEAMTRTASENNRTYAAHVEAMIGALTADFDRGGAVNVIMTHATLAGGALGGGERLAQTFVDYYIETPSFPATTHYVALGHLHRRQEVPGPCPLHYSGAPLQVDFGEGENTPVVVIVDVEADIPARVTDHPVAGGRRLRTEEGTLDQLAALARDGVDPEDWLRVRVKEKPRAGLADDVRDLLPGAIEVQLHPDFVVDTSGARAIDRVVRTPHELFADYLASVNRADTEPLNRLFAELLDEVTAAGAPDLDTTGSDTTGSDTVSPATAAAASVPDDGRG